MGVDDGLVSRAQGDTAVVLRELQSQRWRPGQELRSQHARHPHSPESHERRVASVRAELLPALPSSGAHAPAHRSLDLPSRLSLHRSGEQVAVSIFAYLVREKRRRICLPQRRKGRQVRRNQGWGREGKNGWVSGAFASLASWREKKSEDWAREEAPKL